MDKILGVRIDNIEKQELLKQVSIWLDGIESHVIYTPNPEMLVLASANSAFASILNRSDVNVCDGFGITLFTKKTIERIPGSDLMLDLSQLAATHNKKIYLLGAGEGVALKAAKKLKEKYPTLQVSGYSRSEDMEIVADGERWEVSSPHHNRVLEHINAEKPDILFVAFGHGKQEWWIDTYLSMLPSVKLAMGVGGSFDFLADEINRAPKVFKRFGLEWLWRLGVQPRRWRRIFTAVVIFPYKVLVTKYTQKKLS